MTVTVTEFTLDGTVTEPVMLLLVSTWVVPVCTMTERPTRDEACKAWEDL